MKSSQMVCRKKVRYASPIPALVEFIRLAANGTILHGLNVFQCECCGGFHLGKYRFKRNRKAYGKLADKWIIGRLLTK